VTGTSTNGRSLWPHLMHHNISKCQQKNDTDCNDTLRTTIFCDVTPYTFVDSYQRFGAICHLYAQDTLYQISL
jgi:hypothetical protein